MLAIQAKLLSQILKEDLCNLHKKKAGMYHLWLAIPEDVCVSEGA
jgi:hypothetical protein